MALRWIGLQREDSDPSFRQVDRCTQPILEFPPPARSPASAPRRHALKRHIIGCVSRRAGCARRVPRGLTPCTVGGPTTAGGGAWGDVPFAQAKARLSAPPGGQLRGSADGRTLGRNSGAEVREHKHHLTWRSRTARSRAEPRAALALAAMFVQFRARRGPLRPTLGPTTFRLVSACTGPPENRQKVAPLGAPKRIVVSSRSKCGGSCRRTCRLFGFPALAACKRKSRSCTRSERASIPGTCYRTLTRMHASIVEPAHEERGVPM